MRIVIDARMYQESGVGRYIRNLINHLQRIDQKNEYFIIHLKQDYENLNYQTNFHKVEANFKWYSIKEQLKLPNLLNDLNPDLVHFPHFNIPIFYKGKFVVTIHDLIHQHFQMKRATTLNPLTYKIKQIGYGLVFNKAIKSADKILVPSNYVKKLLIKKGAHLDNKIVVTHEAVDTKILNLAKKIKIDSQNKKILEKFKIKQPYIFYVGNAHPHKNVEGLIKAFLILRERYQYLQLVLSGNNHYFWERVKAEYKSQDIIYTGYVEDEELVILYKNAKAFVMPSFEEGFGIPLLEAMACDCPVISSNSGSLPEIGGNAALYFDPDSYEQMAEKIQSVLNGQNLQNDLIQKGQNRVKLFSWEKLAKQTLEVYQQCV